MNDFTARAYNYFLAKGYSSQAAAALAGQATHESGGSPTIYEKVPRPGSAAGFGIMQWDPPRKAGLYKFAASNNLDPESEQAQLAYIDHELNTSESAAGEKLRNAGDYTQATNAVLSYLRPQGYTEKDPGSSLHYVERYNLGAPLVGQGPISVPPIGPPTAVATLANPAMAMPAITPAVGGASTTDALLTGLLAAGKAQKYSDQIAKGMGLLAAGNTEAPPVQMPGLLQPYRPQGPDIGLPNLRLRMGGLLG